MGGGRYTNNTKQNPPLYHNVEGNMYEWNFNTKTGQWELYRLYKGARDTCVLRCFSRGDIYNLIVHGWDEIKNNDESDVVDKKLIEEGK